MAISTKDNGMKRLIKLIMAINDDVKEFVLKEYIKQCNKKHAIAFL